MPRVPSILKTAFMTFDTLPSFTATALTVICNGKLRVIAAASHQCGRTARLQKAACTCCPCFPSMTIAAVGLYLGTARRIMPRFSVGTAKTKGWGSLLRFLGRGLAIKGVEHRGRRFLWGSERPPQPRASPKPRKKGARAPPSPLAPASAGTRCFRARCPSDGSRPRGS